MKIILKKLCFDNITRVSTLAFRWQSVLLYYYMWRQNICGDKKIDIV